jgi:hypothetical protein
LWLSGWLAAALSGTSISVTAGTTIRSRLMNLRRMKYHGRARSPTAWPVPAASNAVIGRWGEPSWPRRKVRVNILAGAGAGLPD